MVISNPGLCGKATGQKWLSSLYLVKERGGFSGFDHRPGIGDTTHMTTYVHNIDPFAIQFTETFGIRWYGLAYLAGFILGGMVMQLLVKRGTSPLTKDHVWDFITAVAIGTLAGGRLGYAIFYAPELLIDFSASFPFWGVLAVHKGGMASHGGIMGCMLAAYYFHRKHGYPVLHLFDLMTFGGSLGIFFGRIANFINGELYGRVAPEGYTWAVKFPGEIHRYGVEKLKALGAAADALGSVRLNEGLVKLNAETWDFWVSSRYYSKINPTLDAMITAIQNGATEVAAAMAPVLASRYPSQIYQALMEGLLVFLLCAILWVRPMKPGVLGGIFGLAYAVMRIIGEQFRLPDAHLGYQLFGLTRGQWISIAMIGVAIALIVFSATRKSQPMGGWFKRDSKGC